MSGRHHNNSNLTVQQLYVCEWAADVRAGREPFAWPQQPTSHRRGKRKRVVIDGPPVDRPMYRVVNGLVVGLFTLLLTGCVPSDGPPAPVVEVSTDSPNPTVLPPEVITHD